MAEQAEEALSQASFPVGLGLISIILLLTSALLLWARSRKGSSSALTAAVKDTKASSHAQQEIAIPSYPIVYGTQTGTAERFSQQLVAKLGSMAAESARFESVGIEQYNHVDRLPKEKLAVFLMATYGDGEPTDDAASFYSWLQESAVDDDSLLQGVKCAVFGLGNRQYEHFNATGKAVHKALGQLGAEVVVRRGDGDDDDDIDSDFSTWCDELCDALAKTGLLGAAAVRQPSAEEQDGMQSFQQLQVQVLSRGSPAQPLFRDGSGDVQHCPMLATVLHVQELHTPQSERSCVHVELSLGDAGPAYSAGDHVGVFAANAPEVMRRAAELLGLDLEEVVVLRAPDGSESGLDSHMPSLLGKPLTVRTVLEWGADLLSHPTRRALQAMAACAADAEQQAQLRRLASPEGKEEFAGTVLKQGLSLLQVLERYPSAKPSLGLFLGSIAPRLQPRMYSISSGPLRHPAAVHITCAVVQDTMPCGRVHHGVASSWLARLRPGQRVAAFIRTSHFRLPEQPASPVVMVGPGTGLAPFRGFLQEREAMKACGQELGPALLFYGCRHPDHDFLYQEELQCFEDSGAVSQLHVAFSRLGASKDYVQHHLKLAGGQVWRMLKDQGGSIYVCGDAKHMAKDVHRTLLEVAMQAQSCGAEEAERLVQELHHQGRYQRDVW